MKEPTKSYRMVVTYPGGSTSYSWYDTEDLLMDGAADEEGRLIGRVRHPMGMSIEGQMCHVDDEKNMIVGEPETLFRSEIG